MDVSRDLKGEAGDDGAGDVEGLSILNHPPQVPSLVEPLHLLFHKQAELHPDRTAIEFLRAEDASAAPYTNWSINYKDLDDLTTSLARHIRPFQGQIIPVYLTTSPELYISYIAIMKAGCAFCPLPIDAPVLRIREILEELQPSLVLGAGGQDSHDKWMEACSHQNLAWLDVSSHLNSSPQTNGTKTHATEADASTIELDQLAYVMYTSGSTGKPKGVQISHKAVALSIAAHRDKLKDVFPPGVPQRWFQFAAPTFDPSLMEIFVTLCYGETLCAASRVMTLESPETTVTLMKATIMMATPSFAALLQPGRMPTLQCLWVMGETVSAKVIERFGSPVAHPQDPFPCHHMRLCNAYGPTEAAINCTFLPNMTKEIPGTHIGYPMKYASILIVEQESEEIVPLKFGLTGELVIGGPLVSVGYLRKSENKSRFVEDRRYGRLYRSGDRARIVRDADGIAILEYQGRISDEQVKINGQRVELGEIENVLEAAPGVSEVVAIVNQPKEENFHAASIFACIKPKASHMDIPVQLEDELRGWADVRLPAHMRPVGYRFLRSIPRTTAGKLDRREVLAVLDEQSNGTASRSGLSAKPQRQNGDLHTDSDVTSLLDQIHRAIKNALGEATDLMLDIQHGLDSLASLRVLREIRHEGIPGITLRDILEARCTKDLAFRASRRKSQGLVESPVLSEPQFSEKVEAFERRWLSTCEQKLNLKGRTLRKVLPTTTTQSTILLSCVKSFSKDAGKRHYIHHSIHTVPAEMDPQRFRRALSTVMNTYEIYRTVFVSVNDSVSPFAQCILSSTPAGDPCEWEETVKKTEGYTSQELAQISLKAETRIGLENPVVVTSLTSNKRTVLILSILHSNFDLGSLRLLFQDVFDEYKRKNTHSRGGIRDVVLQHFSARWNLAEEHWKGVMDDYEVSKFPQLTSSPSHVTTGKTSTSHAVSVLSMKNFERRSRILMCSPFSAIQVAWAAVLMAYTSNSNDIAFGSVLTDRRNADKQNLAAPNFSVVPTRVHIEQPTRNIDLLRQLSKANEEASNHLRFRVQESVAQTGQYDTILALQAFTAQEADVNQFWNSSVVLPMVHDYAVMLEAFENDLGQLCFKATYNDMFLDEASASLMLEQLCKILVWVLANPMQSFTLASSCLSENQLSILNPDPIVTTAEQIQLLHYPFENHALKFPEDIALEFYFSLEGNESCIKWSYSELNSRANALAIALKKAAPNVSGSIVPILMDKQPELYVAVLGILKAGAAWCPIDADSPMLRRRALMDRVAAKVVVVPQGAHIDPSGLPNNASAVYVSLESPTDVSTSHDPPKLSGDHLAYIIWTSGTTGPPKGVPITHKAASLSLAMLQSQVPRNPRNDNPIKCLQFSQHTFDVFIQDLFYTWGHGGTLISAAREIMVGDFAALSVKSIATHAHLTPAFAQTVTRASCPSLRVVTFIGEKLPQHVADDWSHDIRAFNTYGPAEATIVSTLSEFSGACSNFKSSIIGRPLPSVSCRVIRDGREVPRQGVGELALGGAQLAHGYHNDESKSAAKFINFKSSGKLYMTGDIVRQLANGSLEFIGREDDQVKIGGIRVELGEISFVLKEAHESIRHVETCHFSRQDRPHKALVSFVAAALEGDKSDLHPVCTKEAASIATSCRTTAIQSLPSYMQPKIIIVLHRIPVTASAKVDQRALQDIYEKVDIEACEGSTTRDNQLMIGDSDSEHMMKFRKAISEITDTPLESIHIQSSLPALGVTSINAGKLVRKLESYGLSATFIDIVRSETISDLLQVSRYTSMSAGPEASGTSASFPAKSFDEEWNPAVQEAFPEDKIVRVLPTTSLQEGVLSETMRNESFYWSNHFFGLDPSISPKRLRGAWKEMARVTQALRTCFITREEIDIVDPKHFCPSFYLQVILSDVEIDWAELEVTDEVDRICAQRTNLVTQQHHRATFHRPPWAVSLFKVNEEYQMMFTIHHSLHDADSIDFIIKGVKAIYDGLIPVSREQLEDIIPPILGTPSIIADDENYWNEVLQPFADYGSPVWPDLTNNDGYDDRSSRPAMASTLIDLNWSREDVQTATKRLSASPSTMIKAAFSILMMDYMEASGLVFGEIISHRSLGSSMANVIAPTVTTIPVVVRSESTAKEMIESLSKQATASLQHRSPRGRLVRDALGRSHQDPTYAAMFVFHPSREGAAQDHSTQHEWPRRADLLGLSVEHSLALNVYPDNGWSLEIVANEQIMCDKYMKIFGDQVSALLKAMIRHPEAPLSGILNEDDPSLLSVSVSSLPYREDHPCTLYPTYWVEYGAVNHPDWIAAEVATSLTSTQTKSQTWTYAQLVTQARKIANLLLQRGFQKSVIAMCMGRTLQSYAVIVGIIMSGNCYLPIDEGLPLERKRLLLEDSDCKLLLTDHETEFLDLDMSSSCQTLNISSSDSLSLINDAADTKLSLVDPSQNAYLLYTSGSTGKPKGVLIGGSALCNFVQGLGGFALKYSQRANSMAGKGKWLGLANRAFDVHLGEMFLAWSLGLRAVTAPREMLLDNLQLALTSLRVTHACFVGSLLEQAGLCPENIPEMVFMTVGGEKLSQGIIETFAGKPSLAVVNAYGPTELAIGCTAAHITPGFNTRNIGFPYGNTTAHILLPGTFDYAKKGQAGELCVTGGLVGNGYLNRPDAKGFVTDFHGKRMYRTGDLARMKPDGSIEYLGRNDDQTKIRGQRIELSEVSEFVRGACQDKAEVATLLASHPNLKSTLLVCFISESVERSYRYDADPVLVTARQGDYRSYILEQCRRNLPVYMIPDYVVPVTVIPLARISGKTNSKRLKDFFSSLSLQELLGGDSSQPSCADNRDLSPKELEVRSIVSKALGTSEEQISPSVDLLSLGLDSLNAVGLAIKLKKAEIDCSVSYLLSNATIEAISALKPLNYQDSQKDAHAIKMMEKLQADVLDSNDQEISSSAIEKILPCLPFQEMAVAETINAGEKNTYINHLAFEVSSNVSMPAFLRIWTSCLRSLSIFRTVFHYHKKTFVQIVLRSLLDQAKFNVSEASNSLEARKSFESHYDAIGNDIRENIRSVPPFRLHFTKCLEGSHVALLSIHHALYDRHSLKLLMDSLISSYHGQTGQEYRDLDDLLIFRTLQDSTAAEAYWKKLLKGCSYTKFESRMTNESGRSSSIDHTFGITLSALQGLASELGVTLANLCQGIFATALARLINSTDVIFGHVLSGRTLALEGAESIMGPCLTTVPRRLLVSTGMTLRSIITQTQTSSAEGLKYQHTSLRDISRWVGVPLPMFDGLFSFSRLPASTKDAPWTELESQMYLGYPLAIECLADDVCDTLSAQLDYTIAFENDGAAKRFLEDIELLFSSLLNHENPSILELGISQKSSTEQLPEHLSYDEQYWSKEEVGIQGVLEQATGLQKQYLTKNVTFFQLGIDSVSAIQLADSLRGRGLPASSADVMRFNSIGALGLEIHRKQNAQQPQKNPDQAELTPGKLSATFGLDEQDIEAAYHCTPLQVGMITTTLASETDLYLYEHTRAFPRATKIPLLCEAWQAVVRSLDILRTSFYFMANQNPPWIGLVSRTMRPRWRGDVTTLNLNTIEGFNSPPFSVEVVEEAKNVSFKLTIHHALYDAISLPMIFDRLLYMYEGINPPSIPVTPYYRAAQLIAETASDSANFYQDMIQDYRNKDIHTTAVERCHQVSTAREMSSALKHVSAFCKDVGVTIQTFFLCTYGKAVAMSLGRRDVVLGHVVSGRTLPLDDCGQIVGPLFNTVPFRIRHDSLLETNRAFLKRIQNLSVDAIDHQHAPLKDIQKTWRAYSGSEGARLFNCLFSFQKSASRGNDNSNSEAVGTVTNEDTEYCLNVDVEQQDEKVVLTVSYHSDCLNIESPTHLLDTFEAVAEDILQNPSRALGSFRSEFALLPYQHQDSKTNSDNVSSANEAVVETLRAILSRVSEVPTTDILPSTSIFALGLDSILAIEVAAEAKRQGLDLSVADVLQGASASGIASRVATLSRGTRRVQSQKSMTYDDLRACSIPRADVEAVMPALGGQAYHLASWVKTGRTFHMPTFIFECSGLDSARLESSWARLQRLHSILRTTFSLTSTGEVVQVVLKHGTAVYTNEQHTLEKEFVRQRVREQQCTPVDMHRPLARLHLIQGPKEVEQSQGVILLTIHHALYDAWSLPTLMADLSNLYDGKEIESSPDWARFVHFLDGEIQPLEEEKFWINTLREGEETIFKSSNQVATQYETPPSQVLVSVETALDNTKECDAICKQLGITMPNLIVVSLARTLRKLTQVSNPIIGVFVAGRSSSFPAVEKVAGPCLNLTPVVIQEVEEGNWIDEVLAVQKDLSSRVPYDQSTLQRIHQAVGSETKPLFNFFVNCLWHRETTFFNENTYFKPLHVGLPTEFSPKTAVGGDASLDGLEWPLPAQGIYLDVVRSEDGKNVDFNARIEGGLMEADELKSLLKEVADDIMFLISSGGQNMVC